MRLTEEDALLNGFLRFYSKVKRERSTQAFIMRKSEVLAAEAVSCLNKALILLKDIWEEIGIPEEQRLQRTNTVKSHIKGLLEMMIAEEQTLKQRLEKDIESSQNKIHQLCLELELPPPQEESGLSVLQMEKDLRTRLNALLKEKSCRLKELKDLLDQDQDLMEDLGSEPYHINPKSVPTTQQLDDFRHYLTNQREEKVRREAQFRTLKHQILVLMKDLEHSPETSFEKDLVSVDDETVCLSLENLSGMGLLRSELEQRKVQMEVQCESLRELIQTLWNQLDVPQDEREAFNNHMVQSRSSDLRALQLEAERLEQMKMINIKSISDRVRSEIRVFWDRCFYNEPQRLEFSPYFSEQVSEQVLEVLEAELNRLKQFYKDHLQMFEGVQQWIDSWDLFLDLERKAYDPTRFMNRGGNLLREEKQRTELSKSLTKLERQLKVQISQWESSESRPFLVQGQHFLQFVEQQWNQLQVQKEREKLERHLKKSRQTEEDMLYGTMVRTPSKRRFMGLQSPSKTQNQTRSPVFSRNQGLTKSQTFNKTRRVLLSGCSSSTNSSVRCLRGQVCRSPGLRPPLSSAQIPLVRTPVYSRTPQAQVQNEENQPWVQAPSESQSLGSVAGSYSQFLKDLTETNTRTTQNQVLNSTDL